jgi:two-component system, cell cycle response regulator CtrA
MTYFYLDDQVKIIAPELGSDLSLSGFEIRDTPADQPGASVLMFGDVSGLEDRIRDLRDQGVTGVLLTLRGRRDSARSALLLRAGADDDLLIPVSTPEVLARIRSVERVSGRDGTSRMVLFGICVYADGRGPEMDGHPLPLTAQEGRVLSHLLIHQGRFVTRAGLRSALSQTADRAPSDRVIDVHICNIRRKLDALMGGSAPRIMTGRGRGYQILPPHIQS